MTPEGVYQSMERAPCPRCRIEFRVGLPSRALKDSFTICVETGCKQRFWNVAPGGGQPVVCGIAPEDLPERAYG